VGARSPQTNELQHILQTIGNFGQDFARNASIGVEQIMAKLLQIEVLQGQGKRIATACKVAGATEQSYYH